MTSPPVPEQCCQGHLGDHKGSFSLNLLCGWPLLLQPSCAHPVPSPSKIPPAGLEARQGTRLSPFWRECSRAVLTLLPPIPGVFSSTPCILCCTCSSDQSWRKNVLRAFLPWPSPSPHPHHLDRLSGRGRRAPSYTEPSTCFLPFVLAAQPSALVKRLGGGRVQEIVIGDFTGEGL